MAVLMVLLMIPACLKNSVDSAGGAMMEILSPDCIWKSPLGMMTSSPLSTAQIKTEQCSLSRTSRTFMAWSFEWSGTRNLRISIRPLANVSILMADGKRSSLEISMAAAISGLMAMERPNSSRI